MPRASSESSPDERDVPPRPLRLEAEHAGRQFKIEHDSRVGYYVYAFEGSRCTHDHLQDSLELAKECAREEFGVPENAWREASPTI